MARTRRGARRRSRSSAIKVIGVFWGQDYHDAENLRIFKGWRAPRFHHRRREGDLCARPNSRADVSPSMRPTAG